MKKRYILFLILFLTACNNQKKEVKKEVSLQDSLLEEIKRNGHNLEKILKEKKEPVKEKTVEALETLKEKTKNRLKKFK